MFKLSTSASRAVRSLPKGSMIVATFLFTAVHAAQEDSQERTSKTVQELLCSCSDNPDQAFRNCCKACWTGIGNGCKSAGQCISDKCRSAGECVSGCFTKCKESLRRLKQNAADRLANSKCCTATGRCAAECWDGTLGCLFTCLEYGPWNWDCHECKCNCVRNFCLSLERKESIQEEMNWCQKFCASLNKCINCACCEPSQIERMNEFLPGGDEDDWSIELEDLCDEDLYEINENFRKQFEETRCSLRKCALACKKCFEETVLNCKKFFCCGETTWEEVEKRPVGVKTYMKWQVRLTEKTLELLAQNNVLLEKMKQLESDLDVNDDQKEQERLAPAQEEHLRLNDEIKKNDRKLQPIRRANEELLDLITQYQMQYRSAPHYADIEAAKQRGRDHAKRLCSKELDEDTISMMNENI